MSKDLILSIDNGTQSVRGMVFDLAGSLLAKTRIPIEPYFSAAPGLAEQHPQAYWSATCEACQKLWTSPDDIQDSNLLSSLKERIAGVTLTTQRGTVINLDRNGIPLRPAIIWLDQRRAEGIKPLGGYWGIIFRLGGLSDTVAYLQAEADANWIYTHQREIWEKTHKYVFLSGYLTYKLTGRLVDSLACQVGYVPYDYKHMRWASRFDWKWQAVAIKPSMLVDLVPPGNVLGEITQETAEATGIPAGLPVIAAAADKACEVLGSGGLKPEIGCLSYGTAATINTTHKKYVEVIPLLPAYPAAIPGRYSLEVQVYRGYWMVSWFRDQFGHYEQRIADEQGIAPEALFDALVHAVPPGSQGLILQPYWTPGLRFPGPEARGAVVGFNDTHTRAHFYRAILEGLAYALRDGAERTARRSGVAIRELRVAGGGSQSDAAMQITADVFGLPASRPHVYEASGLGAAIDAAVGLGLHPDFDTAIAAMTRLRDTFEPDPQVSKLYDELYNRIYLRMYNQLRPLYEELHKITRQVRIG